MEAAAGTAKKPPECPPSAHHRTAHEPSDQPNTQRHAHHHCDCLAHPPLPQPALDSVSTDPKIAAKFRQAVLCDDAEAVSQLLGADSLELDQEHPPLYTAASHGALSVVQALIHADANLECVSAVEGCTPLHAAVMGGHDQTVRALLAAKADMESRAECGETALMHACMGGISSTLQSLLEANADPTVTNQCGCTALMLCNSVPCCELLLRCQSTEVCQLPGANNKVSELLVPPFIRPPRDSKTGLWFESCLGAWELLGKEREVVFPFHHLPDYATEVLHVCTVAELILGREWRAAVAAISADPGLDSGLYQSCMYAILEAAKHLITCDSCADSSQDAAIAREELSHFTLAAYEEIYQNSAALCLDPAVGVSASISGALVDMIAAAFFGETFWTKRMLFLCDDPLEQRQIWKAENMSPAHWFVQMPLEVAPTAEAVTSAERRLHAYTSAGCALVADVIPGIHPAYSEMTMRQMLLDCDMLHEKKRDASLRRRKKKKKPGHIQQKQSNGTELAPAVQSSIMAFWGRLDRTARRSLLQIPDAAFDEAIRKSVHWDMLKFFDENYDEFGPAGLLDIDDSSGHITVGKALLGTESISTVLNAQPLDRQGPDGGVMDRASGKSLYEGLALWLMRAQLLEAHGESSREEAALRLQDELIQAEELEKEKGKKAKKKKGKGGAKKLVLLTDLEEEEPTDDKKQEPTIPSHKPETPEPSEDDADDMLTAMVECSQLRGRKQNKPTAPAAHDHGTHVHEVTVHQSSRQQQSSSSEERDDDSRHTDSQPAAKIRLCQRYFNTGECNRRSVCWYAHSLAELEPNACRNFKTKMCHAFAAGNCKFGPCCTFAHGKSQLRGLDDPVVLPTISDPRSSTMETRPNPSPVDKPALHSAVLLPAPLPKQARQPSAPIPAPGPVTPGNISTSTSFLSGFADSSDPIFSPGINSGTTTKPLAVGERLDYYLDNPFGAEAVLGPLDLISDPDEGLCKVCLEHKINVQLLPCEHWSFCHDCITHLDACPLCRTPIHDIRRTN